MKDPVRRAVALIAGSGVSGKHGSTVYDYGASKHFSFSLTISGGNVTAYDYSTNSHIGGSLTSLYHYGVQGHIQLSIGSSSFNGYDYDTNSHFNGTVNGNSVTIFDYEMNQHHHYAI